MKLSPETIKQQTREVWHSCFHDTEDFMDLYFSEKYTDENNLTVLQDKKVAAAMQLLPYRLTLFGTQMHGGYVSGLATLPQYRGRGLAEELLRTSHQRLFREGAAVCFLIPGDAELRNFYAKPRHGDYRTVSFRKEETLTAANHEDYCHVVVNRVEKEDEALYDFYRLTTAPAPFMVHPSKRDFFAAMRTARLSDGCILTAHRNGTLVGLCMAVREADCRVLLRTLIFTETAVQSAFVDYLCHTYGVNQVYRRRAANAAEEAEMPYAMMRVVNPLRFLAAIATAKPRLQMCIGISGDLHVPENNGSYIIKEGNVARTELKPEQTVTPGELAALFLANEPTVMDLLLDE